MAVVVGGNGGEKCIARHFILSLSLCLLQARLVVARTQRETRTHKREIQERLKTT